MLTLLDSIPEFRRVVVLTVETVETPLDPPLVYISYDLVARILHMLSLQTTHAVG
jgi:hypothetical protein